MKTKILIFSLAYYPKHIGGAEVAIKEITDRLSPEQYEFHLVCNRYDSTLPKTEQIGNVKVHRIGLTTNNPSMADLRRLPLQLNKLLFQFQAFFVAAKLHKKEKFDGIWAMMAHSCGVPAGKFKQAFPDVKYLLTLQEGDPPAHIEKKMKWFGKAFDNAFLQADTIQVISNFLGNWAKTKGFAGTPILIPNAVNTAHFTQNYSSEELREVRRELGVFDEDILLVTTSRLVHKNAVDDVIRAIQLLPPSVKFVVFGTGPDEDKLHSLVKELGVTDRVLFRGQIGHADMPKYLKACSIFIRPSRSEGMGNSFVEAMAAELPVIATQEGGIADFLFDEKLNPGKETTGWAVESDNPTQIKEAVEDILNRPDKVTRVLITAKKMVVEKYDWDLISNRMKTEVFNKMFD
ncbi:MAG: glycosyltransferase involved in cell wall biosynthesis [Candidatus Paceibacteria bacterium]|jgi:glycosyltransferase involved in cell wall biosynthesis